VLFEAIDKLPATGLALMMLFAMVNVAVFLLDGITIPLYWIRDLPSLTRIAPRGVVDDYNGESNARHPSIAQLTVIVSAALGHGVARTSFCKMLICVRRVKSLRRLSSRNRGRGLVIQLTAA
jgi:hypothetical protein